MTIYWERCSVCGRYYPTRQCTLYSDVNVCIHCCLTCIERGSCPKPVWVFTLEKPVAPRTRLEEKKRVMEELLSKLKTDSG